MNWPKLMWGVDEASVSMTETGRTTTNRASVIGIAWGKWSLYLVLNQEIGRW